MKSFDSTSLDISQGGQVSYKLLVYVSVYYFFVILIVACVVWCLAREEEKLKVKKQNEALIAERKRLEQRAAQLAESLAVSIRLSPVL